MIWTGGPGGEGVSTFFSLPTATTALADIRAFFDTIRGNFPNVISWSFPNDGDQIESTTGKLVGAWNQPAAATVIGQEAGAAFAAGVGLRVRWGTTGIVGSRRVVGTTFLAPVVTTTFQNDGTIVPSVITSVKAAADALVATNSLVIWSRPRGGVSGFASVESSSVPDRVTALRSRRY